MSKSLSAEVRTQTRCTAENVLSMQQLFNQHLDHPGSQVRTKICLGTQKNMDEFLDLMNTLKEVAPFFCGGNST